MKEIKAYVGNIDARLKINGVKWAWLACPFADDIIMLAERDQYHIVVN